jgi:GH25 family lysozyme M1 (1,4-beta-N-acetylmuramidase)
MALKVIDISYYNTITDWSKVKTACDAVIIRLGYRGCTSGKIVYDDMFKTFLDACKKYGFRTAFTFSRLLSAIRKR